MAINLVEVAKTKIKKLADTYVGNVTRPYANFAKDLPRYRQQVQEVAPRVQQFGQNIIEATTPDFTRPSLKTAISAPFQNIGTMVGGTIHDIGYTAKNLADPNLSKFPNITLESFINPEKPSKASVGLTALSLLPFAGQAKQAKVAAKELRPFLSEIRTIRPMLGKMDDIPYLSLAQLEAAEKLVEKLKGRNYLKQLRTLNPRAEDYLNSIRVLLDTAHDQIVNPTVNVGMGTKAIKRVKPSQAGMYDTKLGQLAREAARFPDADSFRNSFLRGESRGSFYHITDNPKFKINPELGPRDMSSMASGQMAKGKLMVTSTIENWAENYPSRKYVAKIDLSNANPGKDYWQVNRGFGNELFIDNPSAVKVEKVVPIKEAINESRQYQKELEKVFTSSQAFDDFYNKAIGSVAQQPLYDTKYLVKNIRELGEGDIVSSELAGSRATGTARAGSDTDVLVVIKDNSKIGKELSVGPFSFRQVVDEATNTDFYLTPQSKLAEARAKLKSQQPLGGVIIKAPETTEPVLTSKYGKVKLRVKPVEEIPQAGAMRKVSLNPEVPTGKAPQSKIQLKTRGGQLPEVPPGGGKGGQALDTIIPPGQKQKKFLETVQESQTVTHPLKAKVSELTQGYIPTTNKEALVSAQKLVGETPHIAKEQVLSNAPVSADKMATAEVLIKKYEKEGNIDEAIEVVESMDKQLREAGRFIQAVNMWDKLSPKSVLRAVEKVASKHKTALPEEVKKIVYDKSLAIQKMKPGEARENAIFELMSYVAEKMPPTKGEMFEAYRYQNMLSGWKTQERNIFQNIFNTFITRPADLAVEGVYDFIRHPFNPVARDVQLSSAPRYIKNVFTSIPNAIVAAKEAFKRGYSPTKLDFGQAESTIELLRKQAVPKGFSAIPRAMEAEDRFFSTLIATGEKARLLKNGLTEAVANQKALQIAEEYLMRSKLGQAEGKPIISKALDSLGQLVLQGRKIPVIGKPWGWFVPFVTTPINAAKMMVEHSPLGLVGGSYSKQQLARATTGSVVTAMGAMLAAQGRTSWMPPKNVAGYSDKEAKDLYYASGKKPYSVKIGDKWVPMWYFGPFALALAIPAAVKHFNDESPTALTDNQIDKLTKIVGSVSRFIFSQTPLSNAAGFFQILDGDVDVNAGSLAGFTAGQIIPLSGLLRNVAQVLDPVYRKTSGFKGSLMAGLPILSKQLPAYKTPTGEESKRLPINSILPYDIGKVEPGYETMYQGRVNKLQQNAVENKIEKDIEANQGGSQTANNKYFYWDEETAKVKSVNLTFTPQKIELTGIKELDKLAVSEYKSDITARMKEIAVLLDKEAISQEEASKQVGELVKMKMALSAPKKIKVKQPKFVPLNITKGRKISGKTKKKGIKLIRAPKLKKVNFRA